MRIYGTWMVLFFLCLSSGHAADVIISGRLAPTSLKKKFTFNKRFRRDMNALNANDTKREGSLTLSSGLSDRTQLISEVRPVIEDDVYLARMSRSRCLWTAAQDNIALSWEVLTEILETGYTPSPAVVGACTATDPVTRASVRNQFTGTNVSLNSLRASYDAYLELQEYRLDGGEDDACGGEYGLQPTLLGRSNYGNLTPMNLNFCKDAQGRSLTNVDAFCVLDCQFKPKGSQDSEYLVRLRASGTPASLAQSFRRLEPIVKPVTSNRIFARPMRAIRAASAPRAYRYRVEERDDGTWLENFSPNLFLTNVRFFVRSTRAPGKRFYLEPSRVRINTLGCTVTRGDNPGLDLENCAQLQNMTPTYVHNAPEDMLSWEVEFDQNPSYTVRTGPLSRRHFLTDADVMFIEFEVHSKHQMGLLTVSPAALDFGSMSQTTGAVTFRDPVRVKNVSGENRVIINSWIEGPDAAAFFLTMTSNANGIVRPGLYAQYTLGLFPRNGLPGVAEATLVVCHGSRTALPAGARDCSNGVLVRTPIRANFGAGQLTVASPAAQPVLMSRTFDHGAPLVGSQYESNYIRSVMILNSGSGGSIVRSIRFAGADASAFRLHTPVRGADSRVSTIMNVGAPVNYPLPAGGVMVFYVFFDPTLSRPAQPYLAEFVIDADSSANPLRVQLRGDTANSQP